MFNCTGPGEGIRWEVPSVFSLQGFSNSQSPPVTIRIDGYNATLELQQATPTFITTLTIQGVPDITVICSTDVPIDEKNISLTSSSKQQFYAAVFILLYYIYIQLYLLWCQMLVSL